MTLSRRSWRCRMPSWKPKTISKRRRARASLVSITIGKKNRVRHKVNKKKYLLLCLFLGWCGGHRYYEKRYALAAFYTLFFWSVVPFFLCVTDLLIALPMQADENGDILIDIFLYSFIYLLAPERACGICRGPFLVFADPFSGAEHSGS